ncbi:MAG: hypothetical protein WBE68_26235 [Candidatus Nitrosopolaris sp.]
MQSNNNGEKETSKSCKERKEVGKIGRVKNPPSKYCKNYLTQYIQTLPTPTNSNCRASSKSVTAYPA